METIKIPSPSKILDSTDPAPTSTRGKSTSPPKKAKQTAAKQKPKQTKSRNGCITCKAKRLKCDETKPFCLQCDRRKVNCGGYKKDFKWRPFEETNLAVGRPTAKPKKAEDSPPSFSISNHNVPTPPTTELSGSPIPAPSNQANVSPQGTSLHDSPESNKSYASDNYSFDDFTVMPDQSVSAEQAVPGIAVSHSFEPDPLDFLVFLDPFAGTAPFSDGLAGDSNVNPASGPVGFSPQAYQASSESDFNLSQFMDEDNGDIEEIIRQTNPTSNSWNFILPDKDDELFDFSSLPLQPSLADESQEMLAMRFDKLTCGILSIKDGRTENPWRTLIWPVAKDTPALYHALFALSAFHSSKENPSLRVHGVKHMRQSMICLREQIQSIRADTALATSLALAFADTWDQNTRTCVQHLRGAKALMLRVLNSGLQGDLGHDELDRIRFLYNTWTYMDVIARLTSLDESSPQDFNPAIFDLPGDAVHEIDPLMGCGTTLFPLIGRVARLVQKVRKCSSNSLSIVSQGIELKSLIEQWEPPHWFEPPEDPTSEVQHSIQVAHAYRSATLLYLHQAIPEIPSEPAEELAKRVLILLATVPPTSRTTIIQMFPLLAAGAEIDDDDDRKWVMDRWSIVQSRLMLGGVDRCLDVIREVWGRRDKFKAQQERQENAHSSSNGATSGDGDTRRNSIFRSPDDKENPRTPHNRRGSNKQHGRPRKSVSGSMIPNSVPSRRGSALCPLDNIEFERTIRSRLHWVNVMGEWGWEVFLG